MTNRDRHLVSVGALATILLLGFSSATQLTNSISIRNVQRPDNQSNATISRSVQYMNRTWNTTLIDLDDTGAFNNSKRGVSDCMCFFESSTRWKDRN